MLKISSMFTPEDINKIILKEKITSPVIIATTLGALRLLPVSTKYHYDPTPREPFFLFEISNRIGFDIFKYDVFAEKNVSFGDTTLDRNYSYITDREYFDNNVEAFKTQYIF